MTRDRLLSSATFWTGCLTFIGSLYIFSADAIAQNREDKKMCEHWKKTYNEVVGAGTTTQMKNSLARVVQGSCGSPPGSGSGGGTSGGSGGAAPNNETWNTLGKDIANPGDSIWKSDKGPGAGTWKPENGSPQMTPETYQQLQKQTLTSPYQGIQSVLPKQQSDDPYSQSGSEAGNDPYATIDRDQFSIEKSNAAEQQIKHLTPKNKVNLYSKDSGREIFGENKSIGPEDSNDPPLPPLGPNASVRDKFFGPGRSIGPDQQIGSSKQNVSFSDVVLGGAQDAAISEGIKYAAIDGAIGVLNKKGVDVVKAVVPPIVDGISLAQTVKNIEQHPEINEDQKFLAKVLAGGYFAVDTGLSAAGAYLGGRIGGTFGPNAGVRGAHMGAAVGSTFGKVVESGISTLTMRNPTSYCKLRSVFEGKSTFNC